MAGGRAGDIQMTSDGDTMLLGILRGRGGAASVQAGDAQGGAAATLSIDAGGNVQLAGIIDLRGGLARAAAGACLPEAQEGTSPLVPSDHPLQSGSPWTSPSTAEMVSPARARAET